MKSMHVTSLPDVKLLVLGAFEDHRGEYLELYNEEQYKAEDRFDIPIDFVEDDISIGTKGALKGIHGDAHTWKLITCLHGKFYLVVVNYDKESEYFGKWQGFTLSDRNNHQVLVPPKHGNGHLCLSEKSIFHYKQSSYYGVNEQFTIKWNDPEFNVWWPIENPVLSRRDECLEINES
jgi:dTDP-4-dehydrorhamnose 3,5-epimerase